MALDDRILGLLDERGGRWKCNGTHFIEEVVAREIHAEVGDVIEALVGLRDRQVVAWTRKTLQRGSWKTLAVPDRVDVDHETPGAILDAEVLSVLRKHGGELSDVKGGLMARLSRELGGVSGPRLSRSMRRLEERGLVVRKSHPQAGVVSIRLTRKDRDSGLVLDDRDAVGAQS